MVLNEFTATAVRILQILSYILGVIAVLIAWDLFRKRHIFKFTKNFKKYNFYLVIGNAYHTFGKDILTVVKNASKDLGIPCAVWNGHDCHYITMDASEIKVVLNHPNTFNKGTLYDLLKVPFPDTLLISKYERWRKHRKIYSKSFSQSIINSFVNTFYEKACTLVDILKENNNSPSTDIYEIFRKVSLDNFCANIMGLDLDIQHNPKNRISYVIGRSEAVLEKIAFLNYFCNQYLFCIFSPLGRDIWGLYIEIKNIINKIIKQKRMVYEKSEDYREGKLALMDLMLEKEGEHFSVEEICKEIFLFVSAATSTSGVTLAFVFTLLGMNPKAQEKVYAEVEECVGLEGPISYSDIPNLKYTERAILESLRMIPGIPIMERYCDADIDLGDKIIPAGINVLISVFNLHRSEVHWKNPLEYDPDRFLPEEVEKRHPYAFIPFSGGPRNCIGMKYAMMMMVVTVAQVIRKYEFRSNYKSVEDMHFNSGVIISTPHKLDCTFVPRSHSRNKEH